MSRLTATLRLLPIVGAAAFGVILGIGIGNLHGWDLAPGQRQRARRVLALVAPGQSHAPERWIAARLQPVATGVVTGAVWLWLLVLELAAISGEFMAPYSTGIQSLVVGSPLVVHVLIIGVLIVVTFHLLFPIVEPKRRAMLVWRFSQGRFAAKCCSPCTSG